MDVKSRKSTKSRISKAPGFHWWCIICNAQGQLINEGSGPTRRSGLTSCLHQIVDTLLVLLRAAAIWSLCIGLSTTTWPTLLQPSSNSASWNLWVGSYFLQNFPMIFAVPMLQLLLYDFNIPYFLTYFFNFSPDHLKLMIDATIVLYNYNLCDFDYYACLLVSYLVYFLIV